MKILSTLPAILLLITVVAGGQPPHPPNNPAKLPPCLKIGKPLASFQGVVPLLPAPIPPSTPQPTPIPLDSLSFHNFYPFGQLSYPDYTRPNFTTLNTALVHLLLKPSEHARVVVANKTLNPEGGVVKAFALEGFDWKASRNGTGPPMVGEMSVRCWTVDRGRGGEVVEKGGLEFLDARLVKNVRPAHADFGKRFESVRECEMRAWAKETGEELAVLIDNFEYSVWVVPEGRGDCMVPA